MQVPLIFIVFFLCSSAFSINITCMASTFDVRNYGAKGDGITNDADAFGRAWTALCGDELPNSILIVPSGNTFVVSPMKFVGPCKPSKLNIKVMGNIVAPTTLGGWVGCTGNVWLYFRNITGLTVEGPGSFDGQGALWWNTSSKTPSCSFPGAIAFETCNGLTLRGTRHINSPKQHISVDRSNNVDIGNLHISAPWDSHNTDGIDIAGVSHLNIHDSFIGTGDDCVAINGGSFDINITGVTCGPGHGISIGSLGREGHHETVEQVRVENCNISNTQNGLRIKTVPGGSGYAKDISFENINLTNVQHPIIIDQHYCLANLCKIPSTSAVAVSSVTFKNITGTSAKPIAINFNCTESMPCTDIKMDQVHIFGSRVHANCNYARGTFLETWPKVYCN